MSSRSSSRKKEDLAQKGKKKPSKASDDSEDEVDSEDEAQTEIVSLSGDEESSEEVKVPKKRGACSYNKSAFSMPDDISKLMNRVLCTACGKQLNPMNHGAIRKHPWLKVVTCKKCYKFLKSGPFTRDSEGTDEQCRWCGDGGRLYGCDFCHNCFCRSCIKRNLGRSEAAEMESETPKSKWKCYMCKPKKIQTLSENCRKILDYIKSEEEKERKREERAKQREKDKAQAAKEKKMAVQNDKSDDKKDRRSSLPAPKLKIDLDSSKDKGNSSRSSLTPSQSKDCIVIDDSPEKPAFRHANAKSHLTSYNSRPGDGVTQVNKIGNGMTAVTVGPKAKMAVSMPYKVNPVVNPIVNKPLAIQPRPNFYGALKSQLLTAGNTPVSTPIASTTLSSNHVASLAKLNNTRAIKEQIVPFNVESITEKLSSVAQQLNLTMNSVKTDLAIAKLSSVDLYASRSQAAFAVKNGLDSFFNNIRDVFNVQILMNSPDRSSPEVTIKIEDDPVSKKEESLPNGKPAKDGDQKPAANSKVDITNEKMEVDEDLDNSNTSVKDETDSKVNSNTSVKDETDSKVKEEAKTNVEDHSDKKSEDDNDDNDSNDGDDDITNENSEEEEEDEDEENETEKKSKKQKGSKQTDKVDKDTEDDSTKSKSKKQGAAADKNENTAAELDFLKELADEINDSHEKDDESSDEAIETRRSTRRGKSQPSKSNDDDKSTESETNTRKSSRHKSSSREQPESKDEDKNVKGKTSESTEKTSKAKSKDSEEKDSKKESSSKDSPKKTGKVKDDDKKDKSKDSSLSKDKKRKDSKEEEEGSADNRDEKASRSKDKKGKNSKEEEEPADDKDEKASRSKDKKGKNSKEEEEPADDKDEKASRSKDKKRKSSKEEEEDSVDNKNEKASRSKDKKGKNSNEEEESADEKALRSKDKKRKNSKEEEEESADNKDEKASKSKDKKKKNSKEEEESADDKEEKASKSKDRKKKNSKEEEESADDKEEKASKGKDKKGKNSKEEDEESTDEKDDDAPPEDNEDNDSDSSDSDSSVSEAEFGKRKKKRKQREKDDSQDDSKSGSKSRSRNKDKRKDKTDSSRKSDKKDKSSSKKDKSKTKITIESAEEEEENNSDSSNFDPELERDIKSLSKDTKLQRRSTRTAAHKTSEKVSEKKSDSKKSAKSSKDGKDKSSTEDYDDLSSNSEMESGPEDDDDDNNEDGDDEKDDEEDEVEEENLTPAQLRKLKASAKAQKEESDYEDMVASGSSDSEDPEVSFPKLSSPKKGKKKGKDEEEDDSDDSDFMSPKKKKRKVKDELLDENLSASDDSDVVSKKKKKGRGRKRKKESEEEEPPHPEDEIYSDDGKKKKGKGKRKRIRKLADSSDEEKEKKEKEEEGVEGEEGSEGDDDDEDGGGNAHKRRKIRKVIANKKLKDTTKEARKAEDERRKRIEERQKEFNAYVEVEGGESENELPEGTEREEKDGEKNHLAKILGSSKKIPVTTKCVLDMEKESKKVLVEIDRTLVKKLKPHQVEAVRFMYNCCVESIDRMKKEDGAGCILAHCMGLGKTLSVITFLHTLLSNTEKTKMHKCLVVCPLNTVLNWVNEFEIWLADVDYEIDVYEMSRVKQNYERAQMLREWHEGKAGVMILGYDMYRNLVMGNHCKNKKQKATFFETLADPGPDIIVCDEGHILKNDATSLSKAISKIKSRRRIVLTGTPLQNNLGEYHCMVDFVKKNLLGTRKEFSNRFVNPITNGQCTDSSASDVKLMKRRAHILHEMLAGCVQRKDYSALTKFLPPKYEYVVSVRMGPLQCKLYERYLEEAGVVQNTEIQGKNGRLFRDYQALMRIWTHPWVLKLDEIRQENKRTYDSEDSFIDDTDDTDGEDSFITNSTTSESDSDFQVNKKKKKKGKGKRKTRGQANNSSSDSDVKEVNDENEVVKKWTSKRRGNEEGAGSSWMQDMGYSTGPKEVSDEWWAEYVKEEDEFKIELSGKIKLLFEILKMCEDIGDKVLVFSQSLLSLDIIEDFLHYVDDSNRETREGEEKKEDTVNGDATEEDKKDDKKDDKTDGKTDGKTDSKTDDKTGDKKEGDVEAKDKDKYAEYGKSWTVGADYFRMDGSTSSQQRKAAQDSFNDPENYRARLFLISTKAGSLGINLVAANRVIIFDASWNPSHDIQSIFRVYRFGQVKPVYVYRFLAQGTMEEKIYERQVTKQSLSQRVVDEHQIERHFTSADLSELYKFLPDKLDDPNRKEQPLPMLPKDHMLAELMSTQKDWIVTFHEHDSLLENIAEQELSEEEKKAAWEDYENDKKGLNTAYPMYGNMMLAQQRMNNSAMEFQNLVLQGQASLGREVVLQIVQDLKTRFPTLPPEVFAQRVQAVLQQVLTQRIMQQTEYQRRQLDKQKMAELNRLNQIKQQIQQQQAMINTQQRGMGLGGMGSSSSSLFGVQALPSSGYYSNIQRSSASNQQQQSRLAAALGTNSSASSSNSKGDKK